MHQEERKRKENPEKVKGRKGIRKGKKVNKERKGEINQKLRNLIRKKGKEKCILRRQTDKRTEAETNKLRKQVRGRQSLYIHDLSFIYTRRTQTDIRNG